MVNQPTGNRGLGIFCIASFDLGPSFKVKGG